MLKSELIDMLHDEFGRTILKSDITRAVDTIFEQITNHMAQGNRVELRGFGVFSGKTYDARIGRNPRTGTAVDVPEKTRPVFRASKLIGDRLNGREDA